MNCTYRVFRLCVTLLLAWGAVGCATGGVRTSYVPELEGNFSREKAYMSEAPPELLKADGYQKIGVITQRYKASHCEGRDRCVDEGYDPAVYERALDLAEKEGGMLVVLEAGEKSWVQTGREEICIEREKRTKTFKAYGDCVPLESKEVELEYQPPFAQCLKYEVVDIGDIYADIIYGVWRATGDTKLPPFALASVTPRDIEEAREYHEKHVKYKFQLPDGWFRVKQESTFSTYLEATRDFRTVGIMFRYDVLSKWMGHADVQNMDEYLEVFKRQLQEVGRFDPSTMKPFSGLDLPEGALGWKTQHQLDTCAGILITVMRQIDKYILVYNIYLLEDPEGKLTEYKDDFEKIIASTVFEIKE